jgi:hypothetical protein
MSYVLNGDASPVEPVLPALPTTTVQTTNWLSANWKWLAAIAVAGGVTYYFLKTAIVIAVAVAGGAVYYVVKRRRVA